MGIVASLAMVAPAFAQTSAGENVNIGARTPVIVGTGGIRNGANGGMRMPGIFGTVSAVSGNTLTVTSKVFPRPMPEVVTTSTIPSPTVSTVYTVDATNANIYKGSATSTVSVSSIAVGDTVMVQGPVTGTSVAATVIRDGVGEMTSGGRTGMPGRGVGGHGGATSTPSGTGTPMIQGNGEPVIGGSVTAISGTTLTVTNSSNVTYTIAAGSSTIVKNGTSTAFTNIAVGDNVIVQGVVNGTSVTASSVIDQGVKGTVNASTSVGIHMSGFSGIFSAIGGFFQHLFGF